MTRDGPHTRSLARCHSAWHATRFVRGIQTVASLSVYQNMSRSSATSPVLLPCGAPRVGASIISHPFSDRAAPAERYSSDSDGTVHAICRREPPSDSRTK